MEALIVLLMIVVLPPMFVAHRLGMSRDRRGWAWGFFLGWLGVVILACMRPVPVEQRIVNVERDWTPDTMYPPPPPVRFGFGGRLKDD